jgi:predicted protein tyrosine phosphatase
MSEVDVSDITEITCESGKILLSGKEIYDQWKKYRPDLIVSVGRFTPIVHIDMICKIPQIIISIEDTEKEDLSLIIGDIEGVLLQIHEKLKEKKTVSIHCNKGISRAPTILLCYMMKYCRMRLEQAINYLNSKRQIKPNANFIKFLIIYENGLGQHFL